MDLLRQRHQGVKTKPCGPKLAAAYLIVIGWVGLNGIAIS
jgi:hypothetical protein